MIKSLPPIIIFFWGYILFVGVQCRGTRGILNESKLSEHEELCFRRCDIVFQADDKGISSKKMFGRRSCYEKCLREDGEMKSVKTKRRTFSDEQRTSLFKRVRRDSSSNVGIKYDYSNCFPGNANSKAIAMLPDRQTIQFHELRVEGRYQGTIKWEPLRDESVHFTGYKILIVYDLGGSSPSFECEEVTKDVTQYPITYSSSGMTKKSRLDFLVVSVPHSNNLVDLLIEYQQGCRLPPEGPSECPYKPAISTVGGQSTHNNSATPAKPLHPGTTSRTESEEEISSTSAISTVEGKNRQNPNITQTKPSFPSKDGILRDNQTTKIIVAAIVMSCLFAVALMFAIVYYCRRKKYKPFRPVNPLTDLKFEFDAFIIYSSHDSAWVEKTLLPTLEGKHGLKCCVHYRDFTLGIPIRKNMVDSVYMSKKTVAVVSTNFFSSNYCGSELDYALHRLMEKKDDSLVVIKLDDVDRNRLPKELQNRSYIDYPKSTEKETWEKKLIKCLKVTPAN